LYWTHFGKSGIGATGGKSTNKLYSSKSSATEVIIYLSTSRSTKK